VGHSCTQIVSHLFIFTNSQSKCQSVGKVVLKNSPLYIGCHWKDNLVVLCPDTTDSEYEMIVWFEVWLCDWQYEMYTDVPLCHMTQTVIYMAAVCC